jgi:hypothetical protein
MELLAILFGKFDVILICCLILANLLLWRVKFKKKLCCFLIVCLFGLVLPMISMGFEIDKVKSERPEHTIIDNFELLYTYFRFPVYWGIGIIQSIILLVKEKKDDKADKTNLISKIADIKGASQEKEENG